MSADITCKRKSWMAQNNATVKEELHMKYNCANEFDLNTIYRKLVAPIHPQTVKASEFFAPSFNLDKFQMNMAARVLPFATVVKQDDRRERPRAWSAVYVDLNKS